MEKAIPDLTKEIPEDLLALMPDLVESENITPQAQKAVSEMESELNDKDRLKTALAEAEAIPAAPIAINGLFKHPPEFTSEEWDIIVAGIRANLPFYTIAQRVHCSRHFLSRKINENPEVAQLVIDAREGMVDEAEYQMLKAVKGGSLSAQMYVLDHLGRERGWGDAQNNKEPQDDVHITFGEISQADLAEGAHLIEEANKKETPTLAGELAAKEAIPRPATAQELAIAEDFMKEQAKIREQPMPVLPDSVGEAPYAPHDPEPKTSTNTMLPPAEEGGFDYSDDFYPAMDDDLGFG